MSRKIHVVGIGGAGMSAIARVLHERGETVSGSDKERSSYAQALEDDGVPVSYQHRAENVAGADLVLVSAAVPQDNPELVAARRAGLPLLRRHEFWSDLTGGKRTLAVAGSHGKTTTSGLLAWILEQAGAEPSFIVGGELLDLGVNARAGAGQDFVIEADEYGLAFLGLQPQLAIVTNVELDHPDQFGSQEEMEQTFQSFLDQVQQAVILCGDDEGAMRMNLAGRERITYGLGPGWDWRAEELRPNGAGGSDFLVIKHEGTLGLVRSRLPGEHNVRNALAALAAADWAGVEFSTAREALTRFHGARRRFEVLGEVDGVTVIDDYAHHPTEVRATLAATRQRFPQAAIYAVFQPHTYSRSKRFIDELAGAFDRADHVIVTDIFSAREQPDPSIDSRQITAALAHESAEYIADLKQAAAYLQARIEPGDVVITLSAGDGNEVGKLLLEGARTQAQEGRSSNG